MLSEFSHFIADIEKDVRAVSDFIYQNPEIALQEYNAHEKLTGFFHTLGYTVKSPLIEKLPTSFLAEARFGTGKGLNFAFFAEYDALPGMGHACGHNLIAASGIAAFHSAVQYMKTHQIGRAHV